MRGLFRGLFVALVALTLASFWPPGIATVSAQTKKGVILYQVPGQSGNIMRQYVGTDSAATAVEWAIVHDSMHFSNAGTTIMFAEYYWPAWVNGSNKFLHGTLVDTAGQQNGSPASAISGFTPNDGQLLIGRSTDHNFVVAALTGTTSEIVVTNGAGSITLSTPQAIATTSTPTFAKVTLTNTTNQLVLGTTRTVTVSASQPASASRVYTIPDQGAAANFVMSAAAQTIAGVTTFSAGVPITATTNQLILGGASHLLTISSPAIAAASQTYTIPDVAGAGTFNLTYAPQVITGDGAITVPSTGQQTVILTKGSAAAITIVAPTAGTDDGKVIRVIAGSAQAHVITCSTDGFNAKGSSGTVTFTAALGNSVELVAYNGHWYALVKTGVTVA